MIENEKKKKKLEKYENRRDLVFFHMYLIGRMKKLRNGKL